MRRRPHGAVAAATGSHSRHRDARLLQRLLTLLAAAQLGRCVVDVWFAAVGGGRAAPRQPRGSSASAATGRQCDAAWELRELDGGSAANVRAEGAGRPLIADITQPARASSDAVLIRLAVLDLLPIPVSAMGSGAGSVGCVFWGLIWLAILVFISFVLAGFCAGWYIILLPLTVCIGGLSGLTDTLLTGIQFPKTCAENMLAGTPLC
ncbi:uncharacterized protein LOC122394464 [Amphibalanus amphitrite]|uniref:uncharacterized protein LOC122394464 n=1 Tax=Amphibalanus amphitrite TaxID=1232801 RepID=UPI001C9251A4|nr:uncharacterized protein LOC122394464 [Amphibalanus amphitrite]